MRLESRVHEQVLRKRKYYGRTCEEGKKIGFIDGLAALWYIVKFNLLCNLEKSYRSVPFHSDVVRAE